MARITNTLLIVTIAISLLEMPFPALQENLALNPSKILTNPWMLFTSLFVHVNIGHLLMNMVALLIFGASLEKVIGPKKIISVYFTAGLAGSIASFFFYPHSYSLGASGAIMGVVGCLTFLRPRASIWFGASLPVIVFSALWILTDLIGLFVPSDIGNAAHLAGFATGIAFGKMWKKKFREEHEIRKRVRRALK
ncbi:MAG: rhomboid family intramembrane serine protease [Nanoarchaeota archaeon]|nr:rhomboid family intramembrane serine protease [Nanoarchaeota archaeon]MBU4300023.1 rhomboid family intramembrane serine protease [Nanoarchaeota archaeon]MBU4451398.1 rhomboid family intramembrane serine protease [Nanoarchaeota archaeon]MCG2724192.1 rhomboid family intramembrane serine protease [archaeon]